MYMKKAKERWTKLNIQSYIRYNIKIRPNKKHNVKNLKFILLNLIVLKLFPLWHAIIL